jgi:beta-lactamase class A
MTARWIGIAATITCAAVSQDNSLESAIQALIAKSGAESVSVVYRDLATGRETLIGPDVSYHPASTFKLCVMVEVYLQASKGKLLLEDPLPVRNEFRSIADGSTYTLSAADDSDPDLYKHTGESLPIRELVERMITRSSNLATNLLIDRVTAASITRTMKSLGAPGLVVLRGVEDGPAYARGMNNKATARGLARILGLLVRRKLVSPSASDEMTAILKRQEHNEGIPSGLPAGVAVAHKTGWIEKLYHDAAIVYPPGRKPYILVVMTRGLEENRTAPKLVSEISRLAYDAAVR